MGKAFGCIFVLFVAVVIIIVAAAANGIVISYFWEWFIIPAFEEGIVLPLSVMHAIGIGAFVGLVTSSHSQSATKDMDDGEKAEYLLGLLIWIIGQPILTLFLGWIVYSFM